MSQRDLFDPQPLVRAVDRRLEAVLDTRGRELSGLHPDLEVCVQRLREFLAGGKRLRPQFCWWGWLAGGGRDAIDDCAPVIGVAAALELLQACALVHDDLIDRSDTRRGRPAVHRAEAKRHADAGWSGDADHFGSSTALLLGDLALAWADDEFTEAVGALSSMPRVQPIWRAIRTQVLAGQWLDLQVSQPDPRATAPLTAERTARSVILLKTAGYTVTGPLLVGAALAGADASVSDGLRGYGTAVGTAFQLRDDLLGVFGAPEQTGKPAGDDLREGKRTVLLAQAREQLQRVGDLEALETLETGIGNAGSADQVDRLRDIIAGTGAPDRAEQLIATLVAQADEQLQSLHLDERVGAGLRQIAGRAAHRSA